MGDMHSYFLRCNVLFSSVSNGLTSHQSFSCNSFSAQPSRAISVISFLYFFDAKIIDNKIVGWN